MDIIQTKDYFEAHEHNLHEIFYSTKKFIVPDYQRKYAWTIDQLDQFWDDFIKTYESCYNVNTYVLKSSNSHAPHFFGGVVLTVLGDNIYEIIDGQQRITTTCIFMKVIIEVASRIQDMNKVVHIMKLTEHFIKQTDNITMDFEAKLELDSTINSFFREYILLKNNKKERDLYLNGKKFKKNSSQKLISEAYEFFYNKLSQEFPDDMNLDDLYQKILAYITVVGRYFLILKIGVKKKNTAYTIFETLNKRGKDLSESDMIKNELFKAINGNSEDIKLKWDNISENIENEDLTEYIRFNYSSIEENVTPAKLYEKIKELINNKNAYDYLTNLENESDIYGNIININSNYWISYAGKNMGQNIIENLNAIKSMGITNCTPLLLSSAIRYINIEGDKVKFDRILSNIVTFCFRYFTIGGNSVANFEKEIGILARAVRKKGSKIKKDNKEYIIDDVDDVVNYMRSLTPDSLFKKNFKEFTTKSMPLAYYVLFNLEKYLKPGVQPLPHSPKQHIEHIMPKKPSMARNRQHEWNHVRHRAEYMDYVNRLGNLMILESNINSEIKNKDFDIKLKGYKDSSLYYPGMIVANYTEWDFSSIENRQELMSNTALNIWIYK